MPRTCIRFFALLLLLLVAVPALQAAPLLQEGKKTLYQRVVSHPGAMPLKEARDGAPAAREALVPFTVLYVYARQGDWLQVGLDTRAPLGWLKKDQATDWNQSLTLLFTPRTGRDPVLFFKTEKDLKGLCEAADMEKLAKQTKIIRHDIRHILSTIASLAESGDMQAILDFTDNAYQMPDMPESSHYCTDALLDTTLCSYFKSAKDSGILLQASVTIPDILPVDSAGLAICFANALGNAIECCEKLPKEKRKIVFKCIGKPKLMFEIENPQPDRITFDRNGLPHLPEGGMEAHIRSIVAFCEKYGAFYTFTAENGWFKFMVTL